MIKIAHRINKIADLNKVDPAWGVEIDVRYTPHTDRLYLNHDLGPGEDMEKYLRHFKHAFIIFNIKDSGTEMRCIELAKKYKISPDKYFLLDVEHPFLMKIKLGKPGFKGIHSVAVRYSELEPIEFVEQFRGVVDWVWIDTPTRIPIDKKILKRLKGFKHCLCSPEFWGWETKKLLFQPDAIMLKYKS